MNAAIKMIHRDDTGLSDYSKEANGFRCRTYQEWWTEDELNAEYARLEELCEDNRKEEKAMHDEAKVAFDVKIAELVEMGAGCWGNAMKWLLQAEGEDFYDFGFFFYELHLDWYLAKEYEEKYNAWLAEQE